MTKLIEEINAQKKVAKKASTKKVAAKRPAIKRAYHLNSGHGGFADQLHFRSYTIAAMIVGNLVAVSRKSFLAKQTPKKSDAALTQAILKPSNAWSNWKSTGRINAGELNGHGLTEVQNSFTRGSEGTKRYSATFEVVDKFIMAMNKGGKCKVEDTTYNFTLVK